MLIFGKKSTCVKCSGPFDEIIERIYILRIVALWDTIQVKRLLSYHGNVKRIFGMK